MNSVVAEVIAMLEEADDDNLSPEELVVSFRAVIDKIAQHPEVEAQLPRGMIDLIRNDCIRTEQAVANQKEAERRLAIATENRNILQAKFDRTADQLLGILDDPGKGN
jgi:hypothetical protein